MSKTRRLLLLTVLMIGICCGVSAKTLVAYYSFTNNVRTIVNELATQKEVDVVEIQPAEEGLDYAANNYALGTQLLNAINAAPNVAASYPAIKPVSVDLTQYDDIIIATPLWWSQMAAPMQTFLFNNGAAMAGKNIWMIVSSASSGISGVVADAERLIPNGAFQSNQLWIKSSQAPQAASMLNSWLVETGQVSAINNQKMVVLSDPHVMAPGLLVSEGTAWTTYLSGQRKLVDYSQRLFDDMIVRIKRDLRPGLVLISGDLTKDGEQVSHEYVTSKLDELRAIGIKTLVIPGNHDRGSNSDAVYYDGESTTAAAVATNEWFATQYANYGYGVSSERKGTTLTYACEPITGLVVIGIDSGTDGNVSETTLNWVVEKATAARASGKKVIAMMHHPLMPHFTGVDNFVSTAVVGNYETVRNTLADAGIRVVFTGHFHTSDIAKDWNADKSREIYDVNTGSLISYPCDYREVTMSADFTDMAITTGRIADEALPKRIKVTDGNHNVTFELNETSAAQSLYGMLPITKEVQNYSTNEKIFYPETAINYSSDCIEGACPVGTLALFSPWGNVVMYYGAASKYTGLYILGNAVEGADQISELTGDITVSKVEVAKERLKSAVQAQIAAKGMAYSLIAPKAADAFIIHAEGDEAGNANAATVLSQLVSAANMGAYVIGADKAQALKDMANSMLQDKSQYGVEGRENVTADLTLGIELPVTIKLAADGYSTYCSENKLDITKSAGLTAYIVNNVTETTVELQSVNVIPQETGFIVKGTGNALYDLFKGDAAADDVSANQLYGTLTATTAPANTFALSTKKGVTGFYPVNTGLTIPAHKAYLIASGGLSRLLTFEGETTDIMNVEPYVDAIPSEYYSIHGIKVARPTKGIYISNGKKVVIK
ncbi:cyclophilin-like fold protein [uncultured Prevotella sp.]|uniref:cyclophilin-like fold protein n=1 Tax=uncultured Prevotella sp. TaxID=159272 RepID=UPI00258CB3C9|nr:cyclophilin-like fold protein [uncultured Prevotella sp.]